MACLFLNRKLPLYYEVNMLRLHLRVLVGGPSKIVRWVLLPYYMFLKIILFTRNVCACVCTEYGDRRLH